MFPYVIGTCEPQLCLRIEFWFTFHVLNDWLFSFKPNHSTRVSLPNQLSFFTTPFALVNVSFSSMYLHSCTHPRLTIASICLFNFSNSKFHFPWYTFSPSKDDWLHNTTSCYHLSVCFSSNVNGAAAVREQLTPVFFTTDHWSLMIRFHTFSTRLGISTKLYDFAH